MNKIINTKEAIKLSEQLRGEGKTIVLVGGCFDILHIGHILFLEKAKHLGDVLFVLLESDETIKNSKGNNRPIHTQEDRAYVLAALTTIDYVILLPKLKNDLDYDNLLSLLKPTIIATTQGDPKRRHKERQARLLHSTVVDVIQRISNTSTSKLATLLSQDL